MYGKAEALGESVAIRGERGSHAPGAAGGTHRTGAALRALSKKFVSGPPLWRKPSPQRQGADPLHAYCLVCVLRDSKTGIFSARAAVFMPPSIDAIGQPMASASTRYMES